MSSTVDKVVVFNVFDMDITLGPIIYLAVTSVPYLLTLIIIEIVIHNTNKIYSIRENKI